MNTIGHASSKVVATLLLPLVLATGCRASEHEEAAAPPAQPHDAVRLYALDCGRIEITDIGAFGDKGPVGKPYTMSDPCFLVRHPRGTLLWDTGLKASPARSREGVPNPVGREFVDGSLVDQLKILSLAPADVTYVAFSHLHWDHSGNANLFTSSTWLMNRRELDWASKTPTPFGVDPETFSAYRTVKVAWVEGDQDVFGDGAVRILQTPGHTPGHQSLMVKLPAAGTVILSGDLAHTRENWLGHVVPSANDSRESTAASMRRIEALAHETHARFVVQHAPEDFHGLPKFPGFL